ncbi:hypothetical protein JG688_00017423 [Phytophthora aleatoria]|uniref:Uncharacterized protein n=1 Tax=Phytophthora aleatoria TaxID=2496075 RepID=A0A8J5IX65_9STRA|nr:hypothetical protein JG688_00017423 [Phytophthora aleatoria]
MAGGSRRRPSAPPPPLPYDCPLPGEAGHEEISALLVSSLPQETMSDGDGLRSAKTSRRTWRKKTRRLQLSLATQSVISAFSEDDATGLSDSAYEFEVPSTSAPAGPASSAPDAIDDRVRRYCSDDSGCHPKLRTGRFNWTISAEFWFVGFWVLHFR